MALLIIYLHLQNKQLTLDSLTNLPNRSELFQMMEILIENMVMIHLFCLLFLLEILRRLMNHMDMLWETNY